MLQAVQPLAVDVKSRANYVQRVALVPTALTFQYLHLLIRRLRSGSAGDGNMPWGIAN